MSIVEKAQIAPYTIDPAIEYLFNLLYTKFSLFIAPFKLRRQTHSSSNCNVLASNNYLTFDLNKIITQQ